MPKTSPKNLQSRDQRLHERFFMSLPVRVSIDTPGGREVQSEAVAANISSGGAFISIDQPLPIACRVYIDFLISFSDLKKLKFILSLESLQKFAGKPVWIETSGVVIRHENQGMAVIFDDDYQLSPLRSSNR
jgi:hypothetical protein